MLPADLLTALAPFLGGREVLLCNTMRIAPVPWEPWVKNILLLAPDQRRYTWLRFAHHLGRQDLHTRLLAPHCSLYPDLVPVHGLSLKDEFIAEWLEKFKNEESTPSYLFVGHLAHKGLVSFLRFCEYPWFVLWDALELLLQEDDPYACDCLWLIKTKELATARDQGTPLNGKGLSLRASDWVSSKGIQSYKTYYWEARKIPD